MANVRKSEIDVDIAYDPSQTVTQTVATHTVTAAEAGGQIIRVESSIQFYRIGSTVNKPNLTVEINVKKNNTVEANRAINDATTNHSYPIDVTLAVSTGDVITLEIVGTNESSRGDPQVYKYTGYFNLVTHDVNIPSVVTRPPTEGVMGIDNALNYLSDQLGDCRVGYPPETIRSDEAIKAPDRSFIYYNSLGSTRMGARGTYRAEYNIVIDTIVEGQTGSDNTARNSDRSQELKRIIQADYTLGGRCLSAKYDSINTTRLISSRSEGFYLTRTTMQIWVLE